MNRLIRIPVILYHKKRSILQSNDKHEWTKILDNQKFQSNLISSPESDSIIKFVKIWTRSIRLGKLSNKYILKYDLILTEWTTKLIIKLHI